MKSIATKAATKQTTPKDFNLFVLTWPIFLELFLFMLMGSADTFMLSEVSDNAVSAVGAANQYIFIAILIMEVIGNGASIVIAQYIGSNRREDAARISAIAVTLNLMIGVVISTCFILFGKSLLQSVNLQGRFCITRKPTLRLSVAGFFCKQSSIRWPALYGRMAIQKSRCLYPWG